MILDVARLLFFLALMAFAAASDLFTMTISNRVSLALAAGFLALALASGMAPSDILMHLAAGSVVLVGAFACFAFGWIGGGDAKVAASAALWFGFAHLLNYLLYADASHTMLWGDGTLSTVTVGATSGLLPQTYTIYGRIFDKDDGYTDVQTVVTALSVPPTATFAPSATIISGRSETVSFGNPTGPSTSGIIQSRSARRGASGPRKISSAARPSAAVRTS